MTPPAPQGLHFGHPLLHDTWAPQTLAQALSQKKNQLNLQVLAQVVLGHRHPSSWQSPANRSNPTGMLFSSSGDAFGPPVMQYRFGTAFLTLACNQYKCKDTFMSPSGQAVAIKTKTLVSTFNPLVYL
jgi:hypothetical protein